MVGNHSAVGFGSGPSSGPKEPAAEMGLGIGCRSVYFVGCGGVDVAAAQGGKRG